MNVIKENPYRTLGLFCNSTEKELQKQIAVIKRFAEIGKTKAFDYDFPFFGEVKRETDTVQKASSQIEQAKNKVLYSLFWFLNKNHIDEAALNQLKEGNVEKASEFWEKIIKDDVVTSKNYSAILNLSTLKLGLATNNGSFNVDEFTNGVRRKQILIDSEVFNEFVSAVAGDNSHINIELLQKHFVDDIYQLVKPYLLLPPEKTGLVSGNGVDGVGLYKWVSGDVYFGDWKENKRTGFGIYYWPGGSQYCGYWKEGIQDGIGVYRFRNGKKNIGRWVKGEFQELSDENHIQIEDSINHEIHRLKTESGIAFTGLSIGQFIHAFDDFPEQIKQYVSSKFIDSKVAKIEGEIEKAKGLRVAEEFGKKEIIGQSLHKNTVGEIAFLKNIMGSNVQYQMLANKLADELVGCAIAFFNYWVEDASEVDPGAPAMLLLKNAQELKPNGQVKTRLDDTIETIQEFIDDKPERDRSNKIKNEIEFLGNRLKRFQNESDTVSNAESLISDCKPKLQNMKSALGNYDKLYLQISSAVVGNALGMIISAINNAQSGRNAMAHIRLPLDVLNAVKLMDSMISMDMDSELRNRFIENKRTLENMNSKITTAYNSSSNSGKSGGNCYIATMAYGSYDHPQVLVLRKFRDEKLATTIAGRSFIRFYYWFSPKLVSILKNQKMINQAIRAALNTFIKTIK